MGGLPVLATFAIVVGIMLLPFACTGKLLYTEYKGASAAGEAALAAVGADDASRKLLKKLLALRGPVGIGQVKEGRRRRGRVKGRTRYRCFALPYLLSVAAGGPWPPMLGPNPILPCLRVARPQAGRDAIRAHRGYEDPAHAISTGDGTGLLSGASRRTLPRVVHARNQRRCCSEGVSATAPPCSVRRLCATSL